MSAADGDLAALAARADGGDGDAAVRLGERLISGIGGPLRPGEGVRRLLEAEARGEARAPFRLATLAAMGAGLPQSWAEALRRLELAAARGCPEAAAVLALLSAGPLGSGLGGKGLVEAWLARAERRPLAEAPRIRLVDACLGPAACAHLIAKAEGRVRPALVYDEATGEGRRVDARSNAAHELSILDLDVLVVLLRARLAALVGVPPVALEPPQILAYAPGERFERHVDYLDPGQPGMRRDIELRGQRIATALVYLNEDYAAGETDFPLAGVRIKGQTGAAAVWANVGRDGAPDPLTVHVGLAPTAGRKWVFSQWMRDRAPPAVG